MCVQNALKLAYVHLSVQNFSAAKGRVGLEGMEWEGKTDEGEGRDGEEGK
jgi:hypothetical protein